MKKTTPLLIMQILGYGVAFIICATIYFLVCYPIAFVCGILMGIIEAVDNATQFLFEKLPQ